MALTGCSTSATTFDSHCGPSSISDGCPNGAHYVRLAKRITVPALSTTVDRCIGQSISYVAQTIHTCRPLKHQSSSPNSPDPVLLDAGTLATVVAMLCRSQAMILRQSHMMKFRRFQISDDDDAPATADDVIPQRPQAMMLQ